MSLVERQQAAGSISIGDDDGAEVSKADVKVVVPPLQVHDHTVVARVKACDGESPSRQISEKRQPRPTSEAASQKVVHLGRDWGRDDELAGFFLEKLLDAGFHRVTPIGHRYQGRGVDHQGQAPKPSS